MAFTEQLVLFSFILMRISGCILFNPIFGRKNIPALVKAGMIMVLTYAVFSFSEGTPIFISSYLEYGILLLKEAFVGFVLGMVANFFLYVIIFAGEIIDMQMGISMSKIYDAQSNASIALTATFYNMLFMLLFFSVDGHVTLMRILITTGQIVPYGQITISPEVTYFMVELFSQCTMLAMKFTFPILGIEFLIEVGVGILMRAIPQINVFVVNIQVKIFVGFILMLVLFTPLGEYLLNLITIMLETINHSLTVLR